MSDEAKPRNKPPPGRGRPVGSASRMAKESREKAQLTGLLPHEILLDIARGNPQPEWRCTVDKATGEITSSLMGYMHPDLAMRVDAAGKAAPYYAPKISTVEVTAQVNDDELDRIIASLATEAGVSLGFGGEGEEGEGEGAPVATTDECRRGNGGRISGD